MKNWTTTQSDFWDMLALKAYGVESGQHLMHKVIEANIWGREIAQFSGGLTVAIPEVSMVTEISLVPWKRATAMTSEVPLPTDRGPIFLGAFETIDDLPRVDGVEVRVGDLAYVRYGGALVQAIAEGSWQ